MTRAAVLILALLAAACGSPTQSTSPFADNRVLTANALQQAQAEWAVHGPARYSALVTRYCYCGMFLKRVRVVVERGVVISARAEDGTAANPTDFPSVEQQFALLSEA